MPEVATRLVAGLVHLFWDRYDEEQFHVRYTLDDLRAGGAILQDTNLYVVQRLISQFGLGQGDAEGGWAFPEPSLEEFVGLECEDGDDYLDLKRISAAANRRIVDAANALPSLSPEDLDALASWRRVVRLTHDDVSPVSPQPANTVDALWETVNRLVDRFRQLIEDRDLWRELWSDRGPRHESTAQRLFYVVASSYCEANNLDITPEADTGRGCVDFKISSGFSDRLLVELKLSTNARLIHGYEAQLALYKKAERTTKALYLVLDVGEFGQRRERLAELKATAEARGEEASAIVIVNGNPKESASVPKRG